ncbi:MAG: response regulator, partial [Sulfurimonas sp.]|nr:response regulator [Sulfurimonas sp.]
ANHGQEALDKYEIKQYDLIITDLTMPFMDGIALAEQIKFRNESQQIIVLSAHSENDKLIKLINIGVDGFLLKPVDVKLVIKQLSKTCQALYDHKMLEYFNLILEEITQELKDSNIELENVLNELMKRRTSIRESDIALRELSDNQKMMLYTRSEKIGVTEFHSMYPFEIDKRDENLEELEDIVFE